MSTDTQADRRRARALRVPPAGPADIDYVVVREGKNLKGRLLGLVLRTVGKSRLETAFVDSVKTIEARNYEPTTADSRTPVVAIAS